MKIGIITFWRTTNNYGAILQCFALQHYLRNRGHEAYVIRYYEPKIKKKLWSLVLRVLNPLVFYRYFHGKFRQFIIAKEEKFFPRHFEEFSSRYIAFSPNEYVGFSNLKENPPEADVYCVGSDQVWNNYKFNARFGSPSLHAFFLDFGNENVRRISYAASFGTCDLPEGYVKVASPLLKKFNFVSVREKTGIDLCAKLGCNNAKWVCDPTLLLDVEEYRQIYRENPIRKRERKYLLLYFLGHKTAFDVRTIYSFAKKRDLDVVLVTANSNTIRREKFFPTAPEWLYLVDNAEYVVTNSFHGAVFSTIFGKQYGVMPCAGSAGTMNTRLDSLFELCNIEPRWLEKGKGFDILDKPYKADVSSFRQESIQFLNETLSVTQ